MPPEPGGDDSASEKPLGSPTTPYPDDASPFQPDKAKPLVNRVFPVTQTIPHYPKRSLRRDLIAGVTVAALALPSGMAYAQLAGLSPIAGLYALLLPVIAYVLLGSSRQLIVGPEGALAVMVAAALGPMAAGDATLYGELAAILALMVGAIYLVAWLIRLGWVADYFSKAVLVGYLHGVAVVLIVGQLAKLTGVEISAQDPIPQLAHFLTHLNEVSATTLAVGLISIAVLFALRLTLPKIPAALVVVVLGIAAAAIFDLKAHGVAEVGHIPSGLPSLKIPNAPWSNVVHLLPDALGIFAVGFADSILTARSFAGRHGQHVRANQELLASGVANAAAGFSQSFPVGASGSRTAVNDQMGGRTQFVGLISAAVIAIILLLLTAPVALLPKSCLGAIIVVAAIGLIEPAAWRSLLAAGKRQVIIAGVTTIGVIAVGVLNALIVAVVLSIVDVVARTRQPHDAVLGWVERLGRYADVATHPSAQITPGVVVYRLDERLIFTSVSYVKGRIQEAINGAPTKASYLVFDAESVDSIDASGVEMLEELHQALAKDDITLVVARLKGPTAKQFETTGLTSMIGPEHFFGNVRDAVLSCSAGAGGMTPPDLHQPSDGPGD
jgi:SulP family sulfate permease